MSKASDNDKSDAKTETVRAGKGRETDPGGQDTGETGKAGRGVDEEKPAS